MQIRPIVIARIATLMSVKVLGLTPTMKDNKFGLWPFAEYN